MLTCSSPWLFAACYVLRRQSVPWHPPCALISLIFMINACRLVYHCFAFCYFSYLLLCAVVKVLYAIPENDIVKVELITVSPASLWTPPASSLARSSSLLLFKRRSSLQFRSRFPALTSDPLDLGLRLRRLPQSILPRKEVIQPHLPIRLPCYDFTPVISLTFGS